MLRLAASGSLRLCLLIGLSTAVYIGLKTPSAQADVRGCHCEALTLEAMRSQPECSLCVEAEKQPPYIDVFFLKDRNPTKPNRTLALLRTHTSGGHSLANVSPELRHILWAAAIEKAQETWGSDWGIAYNGDERRTQCHTHLHIGKLLPDQELLEHVAIVNGPADIPAPSDGTGLWVHPVGNKLHVHLGQQVNETVLMR